MERSTSSLRPVDYAFSIQGFLLLANGFYTLLYPAAAIAAPSPLAGTPTGVVHALR